MLPNYIGILISHCKDPYEPIRISFNVIRVLLPLLRCTKHCDDQERCFRTLALVAAAIALCWHSNCWIKDDTSPRARVNCPWSVSDAIHEMRKLPCIFPLKLEIFKHFFLRTHFDVKLFHSLNAWPFWICSIFCGSFFENSWMPGSLTCRLLWPWGHRPSFRWATRQAWGGLGWHGIVVRPSLILVVHDENYGWWWWWCNV